MYIIESANLSSTESKNPPNFVTLPVFLATVPSTPSNIPITKTIAPNMIEMYHSLIKKKINEAIIDIKNPVNEI